MTMAHTVPPGALRFLGEGDVPAPNDGRHDDAYLDDTVVEFCGAPQAGNLTAAAALGLAGALPLVDLAWPGAFGPDLPNLAIYLTAPPLLLMATLAAVMWTKGRRPTSWVMRAVPDGLYLRFRSYLNDHFDPAGVTVVFVPRKNIEWLRRHTVMQRLPSERGPDRRRPRTFLDIALQDVNVHDLRGLHDFVREESERTPPRRNGGRTKFRHAPLRVLPEAVLRLDLPRVDRALDVLALLFPVRDPVSSAHEPFAELGPKGQAWRIIELAEQGDRMAAVKLARRSRGLGLKAARAYVDDLVANNRPDA